MRILVDAQKFGIAVRGATGAGEVAVAGYPLGTGHEGMRAFGIALGVECIAVGRKGFAWRNKGCGRILERFGRSGGPIDLGF